MFISKNGRYEIDKEIMSQRSKSEGTKNIGIFVLFGLRVQFAYKAAYDSLQTDQRKPRGSLIPAYKVKYACLLGGICLPSSRRLVPDCKDASHEETFTYLRRLTRQPMPG